MAPFGYKVDDIGGVDHFNLSHPANMDTDGPLRVFSEIVIGTELILIQSKREQLVARAERVTELACQASLYPQSSVLGGLVVYCAGCMLTVNNICRRLCSASTTPWIELEIPSRALSGKALRIFDLQRSSSFNLVRGKMGLASCMCVPLWYKKSQICIIFFSKEKSFFGPEHLRLMKRLGTLVGHAQGWLEMERLKLASIKSNTRSHEEYDLRDCLNFAVDSLAANSKEKGLRLKV